jgi:hypothetical protein
MVRPGGGGPWRPGQTLYHRVRRRSSIIRAHCRDRSLLRSGEPRPSPLVAGAKMVSICALLLLAPLQQSVVAASASAKPQVLAFYMESAKSPGESSSVHFTMHQLIIYSQAAPPGS